MFVISICLYDFKTRAVVESDHQDYWLLACQHLISLPLQTSHCTADMPTETRRLVNRSLRWHKMPASLTWRMRLDLEMQNHQIVRIAKSHHIVSPNDHYKYYKIVSLYHNASCIKFLHGSKSDQPGDTSLKQPPYVHIVVVCPVPQAVAQLWTPELQGLDNKYLKNDLPPPTIVHCNGDCLSWILIDH